MPAVYSGCIWVESTNNLSNCKSISLISNNMEVNAPKPFLFCKCIIQRAVLYIRKNAISEFSQAFPSALQHIKITTFNLFKWRFKESINPVCQDRERASHCIVFGVLKHSNIQTFRLCSLPHSLSCSGSWLVSGGDLLWVFASNKQAGTLVEG